METKAQQLFKKANDKLKEAGNELMKPEVDVVTYAVCKNAQLAIENYLKAYLLHNEINPDSYKTIGSLFEQCKIFNKKFEKIDISDIRCKWHTIDSTFCNEVSKVSNCYNAADNLDTFLRQEKII